MWMFWTADRRHLHLPLLTPLLTCSYTHAHTHTHRQINAAQQGSLAFACLSIRAFDQWSMQSCQSPSLPPSPHPWLKHTHTHTNNLTSLNMINTQGKKHFLRYRAMNVKCPLWVKLQLQCKRTQTKKPFLQLALSSTHNRGSITAQCTAGLFWDWDLSHSWSWIHDDVSNATTTHLNLLQTCWSSPGHYQTDFMRSGLGLNSSPSKWQLLPFM